jgi:hypothetical protein
LAATESRTPEDIMPKYKATVHVTGLSGDSPTSVRTALDDQLKRIGLENCRIVTVEPENWTRAAANRPPATPEVESAWRRQSNAGGLLLVAAAAWALWFFWWMFSVGAD